MDKKLMNYNLMVSISKQKGFWLVDKLGSDYLELFTKESTIKIVTCSAYEDLIVIEINLKNVPFEEVKDFEDELIKLDYLGDQWKMMKETSN